MENDLSSSQSSGGLRIANPDSTLPTSSGDAASPVELQPRRHSIFNLLRRGEQSHDISAASQGPPEGSQSSNLSSIQSKSEVSRSLNDQGARIGSVQGHRQLMPLSHQAQQQAQFPPYQSSQLQSASREYAVSDSSRPLSGLYSPQAPTTSTTAISPPREPDQLRSEGSRSSMASIPTRSDSSGSAATQPGIPSRESSQKHRSHGQNYALPAGNGPLPPRHSSRGMGGGYLDMAPTSNHTQNPSGGSVGPSVEDWKDKGAAVGIREEYDADGKLVLRQVKKGVKDFSFTRTLGEGSYSTVVLATDRQTLKEYAVKILDKKHIIKEKKIKYVNIEKDTLNRLIEHPGIVRLYYTFQDSTSLYYVLDVASGGELLGVLKKIGSFDDECTKFYGAQILCAIEHMHSRGVIHRDLKPENVLLDDQMHIKITDFGTAKLLQDPRKPIEPQPRDEVAGRGYDEQSSRASSFVGTAEYVSPELLTDKNACKASDLWAFGCIIYQLLTGRPPFKAATVYLTFQKIVALEYEFPRAFPLAARDLIERLLVLDPQRRLSIEHIKNHEFFDGVKFGRSLWRMKAPRLKPYTPPTQEASVIKLNGYSNTQSVPSKSRAPPSASNSNPRPQPRVITELPPPTQLDIEWSPVLTRANERILKLGNLMVLATPLPHSPGSKTGDLHNARDKNKLSRFFGGTTTKKRQRLVIVTSSARIILAAAGGDEKKAKSEISLLASECSWRTQLDAKGQTVWCLDTRGVHYTFEDTKLSTVSSDPAKSSAQEWIEALERAKDIAFSQSSSGSYANDNGFDMSSSVSSPSSTMHEGSIYPESFNRAGRNHLTKSQNSLGGEEQLEAKATKRNRFSKRQSKNGLSTPF